MRVAADRLIFLALAALQVERERCRTEAVQPLVSTRLALAVLFSFSRSGERKHYDEFWRELQDPHAEAYSDSMGATLRANALHTCFEWITRDVGAPGNVGYRAMIDDLVRGPPKHRWRPGRAFSPVESARGDE
jgi:hypothetical protein